MALRKNLLVSLAILSTTGVLLSLSSLNVFSLDKQHIAALVADIRPSCTNISDCDLKPGDILIRRHLTDRTRLAAKIFEAYFTHSGVYVGTNGIVEAVGQESNPKDEILVSNYAESDWVQTPLESWLVLRPRSSPDKVGAWLAAMTDIANDPEYTFGIPWPVLRPKKFSCADLVWNQLLEHGIVKDESGPKIITPDYLAWYALTHRNLFFLVGYKL